MPTQSNFAFALGIVARLRIVFLMIAVLMICTMAFGFNQLRKLSVSVDQLTLTAVAVFVKTEETERSLKNLLVLLQSVENIDQLSELAIHDTLVQQPLAELRKKMVELTHNGPSAHAATDMMRALDNITESASQIVEIKQAMLAHDQNLKKLGHDLSDSHENTQLILENMSNDDSILTFPQVLDGVPNGTVTEIEQYYRQKLLRANTLTATSLGLEAVFEAATRLNNFMLRDELEVAEDAIRFKIRNIALLIGQLPNTAPRTELAMQIVRMRTLLFGDNSMTAEIASLQKSRRELRKHVAEQLAQISSISAISETLTEAAHSQIELSRQDVTKTTDAMMLAVFLATALSLIAIGTTVIFVVEKQINARMASLTKAVLSIANGETSYEVNVSGNDELGKMARALNVFKLNAKELNRSNIELEKFAYVAAHDLRSPLRGIQDLTQWTLEDPDTIFSDDRRENMGLLQCRIIRLNNLLTDLLEYSRVGKEAADLTDVSIEGIVSDTSELLNPENKFEITYSGEDEPVFTYATPLRQIFLNLINNAIKHHDRSSGTITVTAQHRTGRISFSVQDDGPGIAPKYHGKIFGLFQTLRPRDDVEGSGQGLAIIRKLVEHYGGSITVHSDPERSRGTRFEFDLPEKSSDIETQKIAA